MICTVPQIELTSSAEGIHWRLINKRKPTAHTASRLLSERIELISKEITQRTRVTISNCQWWTYVSPCTINDKARGIQLSDLSRLIYRCDLISESITHCTVNQIRQLRSRRVSRDTSTAATISSLSCLHRSYQLFLKLSAVVVWHC